MDTASPEGETMPYLEAIARDVVGSGSAWISTVRLADRQPALRACITNYRTGLEDLDALVAALGEARRRQQGGDL